MKPTFVLSETACHVFSVSSGLTAILWCRIRALPWIRVAASPFPGRPARPSSHRTWSNNNYNRSQVAGPLWVLWDLVGFTSLRLQHALHPPTVGPVPSRQTRTGQTRLGHTIRTNTWGRGKVTNCLCVGILFCCRNDTVMICTSPTY
jgi:hypothetical protein